jgi:prepilin-type N-terminal cleavage/methylation domain-containing protein
MQKQFKLMAGEKGVTLIETLVALAVLGLVAVAFLGGTATMSRATLINDRQETAQSLAQSQLEYVKSQDYIDFADPGHGDYVLITPPAGYGVAVAVAPTDPETGQPLPSGQDQGIQKISVTVSHEARDALTLEGCKVYR